jgi:multiple sugar transport system substrate-binding protein
MRRVTTAVVLIAALGVMLAGLASSSNAGSAAPARAEKSVATTNLTIWVGWSARELNEFKKVVAEWDRRNANVTVKVVGAVNDDKIIASLRAGNAPDVVSSFTSQNVGIYCSSGGWVNLGPYLARDKINTNIFPASTRYYTQYNGTRCALPLLADVYGFYYNKRLFREAGLTRPPRNFSELTAYAKRLTKRKADGSLDVVGYSPFFGFYQNTPGAYQPLVGAKYFDSSGKSSLGKDPAWTRLLTWQKGLIDYYGHSRLVRWQAGAGDEFSASHAFERGKLAMMIS